MAVLNEGFREIMKADACIRCGSDLAGGRCMDVTCPFSDHDQQCSNGWAGHPEMDEHPTDDAARVACDCQPRR